MTQRSWLAGFCILALLTSCRQAAFLTQKSPREVYSQKLKEADLDRNMLGRKWIEAGEKSLAAPLIITLPYNETGFFPADNPIANGYRFKVPKGRKILLSVRTRSQSAAVIFAELLEVPVSGPKMRLLEYADSSGNLNFEADENTELILRLQPELLETISYSLTIIEEPSLAFPVSSGSSKDVGSIWGDPRDAGIRKHEGIDIFGRRGTPVLAAAPGRVTSVREGKLGGKTVWMKPAGKNISLYYAHLDEQLVTVGQRVETGDTLGRMGNTGNASTTTPHLHFGIYDPDGAINPLPYVDKGGQPGQVKGDIGYIGKDARTVSEQVLALSTKLESVSDKLPRYTFLSILAATGGLFKVLLPDGKIGFIPAKAVELLGRPIGLVEPGERNSLLASPYFYSAVLDTVKHSQLKVSAYYQNYAYVKTDTLSGWVTIAK